MPGGFGVLPALHPSVRFASASPKGKAFASACFYRMLRRARIPMRAAPTQHPAPAPHPFTSHQAPPWGLARSAGGGFGIPPALHPSARFATTSPQGEAFASVRIISCSVGHVFLCAPCRHSTRLQRRTLSHRIKPHLPIRRARIPMRAVPTQHPAPSPHPFTHPSPPCLKGGGTQCRGDSAFFRRFTLPSASRPPSLKERLLPASAYTACSIGRVFLCAPRRRSTRLRRRTFHIASSPPLGVGAQCRGGFGILPAPRPSARFASTSPQGQAFASARLHRMLRRARIPMRAAPTQHPAPAPHPFTHPSPPCLKGGGTQCRGGDSAFLRRFTLPSASRPPPLKGRLSPAPALSHAP